MQTITLDLGARSYPIIIAENLFSQQVLSQYIRSRQVLIVTNDIVAPLYLAQIKEQLINFTVSQIILSDGEQYKTLASFEAICTFLLDNKHNRDTTIVALGGGVVGDIAGFAAACYQRGVDFIQIPTSLLAQVDSAVGGKTAVNHPLGKNMIGAFYQPRAVLIDINSLHTLPPRQISAGLAEVIKYGAIADIEFFAWLENNIELLLALDPQAVTYAISRSCQLKATIVAQDETEQGRRALLNFGHTLGHGIEACQNYTGLLHGEAVAVGMLFAAKLSCSLSEQDVERIAQLLIRARLPIAIPQEIVINTLTASMALDKKVLDNKLRWVLLEKLGKAYICDTVSTQLVRQHLVE
jgi:3-dehydroquinate synthase